MPQNDITVRHVTYLDHIARPADDLRTVLPSGTSGESPSIQERRMGISQVIGARSSVVTYACVVVPAEKATSTK